MRNLRDWLLVASVAGFPLVCFAFVLRVATQQQKLHKAVSLWSLWILAIGSTLLQLAFLGTAVVRGGFGNPNPLLINAARTGWFVAIGMIFATAVLRRATRWVWLTAVLSQLAFWTAVLSGI